MPLTPELQQKYIDRFSELIAEGEALRRNAQSEPGGMKKIWLTEETHPQPPIVTVDWSGFVEWKTKCISLLSRIVATNSAQWRFVEYLQSLGPLPEHLDGGIATLKGTKDDFEKGFLGDLAAQIAAEIAADYMGQADGLLQEGQSGKFDHVPAAVLAGAVLEQALRRLCDQHQPPIETTKTDGSKKTLNPLIDDLKKG